MNVSLSARQILIMQHTQSTGAPTIGALIKQLLAASVLLLIASTASAQSTVLLDSLSENKQEAISRVCLPVQYREGAAAYRNCVQAEIAQYESGSSTELGQLSFDDKYAVQQACAKAGAQSSGDYQNCVTRQINEMNTMAAPDLSQLSEDELYVVQQSCFNAQSNEGAASYRRCVSGEVASLLSIPAADTSQLDMLKKNALQLRCSSTSTTAVRYRQCVAAEYESFAGTAPSFLPVSTAAAVSRPTYRDNTTQPVAEAISQVGNQPSGNTAENPSQAALIDGTQTSKPTMALPRNIRPPTKQAAAAEIEPVVEAPEAKEIIAAAETVAPEPEVSEPIVIAQQTATTDEPAKSNTLRDATGSTDSSAQLNSTSTSTAGARVISRPDLVETLELQERAQAQGVELEPNPNTTNAQANTTEASETGAPSKLTELWQSFLNWVASLDRIGWLIIAGVLALPALLLGVFSISRKLKQGNNTNVSTAPLTERIEPGLHTRRLRQEQEAAALFDDDPLNIAKAAELDSSSAHDIIAEQILPTDHTDLPDHDAMTRLAPKSDRRAQAQPQSNPQPGVLADSNPPDAVTAPAAVAANDAAASEFAPTKRISNELTNGTGAQAIAWQSAFGRWLMQQPAENRRELCTEFLVYWVAYSDERYQPELRKRLFTATDLSPHDQIKRWVLKQDVFAFADVIGWLRQNCSQKQLDQCVGLIMALLVTENNLSPVQNTLLRFFSDAFNIGIARLEQRFERAFGHALPPIPRPDNSAWWAKQDPTALTAWDARAISGKSENEQMRARLGLQENYDEGQVINAFRRAARRCHPDRFTTLGERERALAEQQFIKFEQARDKLLGVSV